MRQPNYKSPKKPNNGSQCFQLETRASQHHHTKDTQLPCKNIEPVLTALVEAHCNACDKASGLPDVRLLAMYSNSLKELSSPFISVQTVCMTAH